MPRPGIVVHIDASSLTRVGYDIERVAKMTPQVVNSLMWRMVNNEKEVIQAVIPESKRPDSRYPVHLRDSISVVHDKPNQWDIVTGMSDRWHYYIEGTDAHPILPLWKKALWWPGIQGDRPVASVNHPGSRSHPQVEAAIARFEASEVARRVGGVTLRRRGSPAQIALGGGTPADTVAGMADFMQQGILGKGNVSSIPMGGSSDD